MNSSGLVASPQSADLGVVHEGGRSRWTAPAPVLTVLAITVAGAVIRLIVAHQSVFADELSTYWISATHGLGGVLSLLYGTGHIAHAEITPPLSFLASWLSTRFGDSPELLRAPSLLAGTATIPLVYLLGLRTVGRRAALVATALTALSPFMIYYSTEARAYGLLMFLVVGSTLAMLLAIDTRSRRWWLVYALCSSAAFYTHYTCAFVLAAQLAWALWAHPEVRREALVATVGAAVLVVPWIPGLLNDLRSPTLPILSTLAPFSLPAIRTGILHWAIGYPYTFAGPVAQLPGVPALVLLGLALGLGVVGLLARVRAGFAGGARSASTSGLVDRFDRRVLLILTLAVATAAGEIIVSTFGDHIFGVRDLGASWPFFALAVAAALLSAGPRLGASCAALAILAFALGTAKMFESHFERPAYQAAAGFIAQHAGGGDVVVDETGVVSPGPLTGLDVALHRRLAVVRGQTPAERDHPFGFFDPVVPLSAAVNSAIAAAHGHRVVVVTSRFPIISGLAGRVTPGPIRFPAAYRLVGSRSWGGIGITRVAVYAPADAASR